MRFVPIVLFSIALLVAPVASPVAAQPERPPSAVPGPGDRGAVLLTALGFATALSADSVGVAGCSVEKAVGEQDYHSVVRPALGDRLLDIMSADPNGLCAVRNLHEEGTLRLYIEQLVEVRRTSTSILPYPERLQFILTLQVWRGSGYREWHSITVRPDRFETADGELASVSTWRVVSYEVTGWEWIHDYSRSGGPIR